MKKFILITFLILFAAALTFLSMPKEMAQEEISKDVKLNIK